MAILFDRNTYIHYGPEKNNFNDDWIHFHFVDEPSLLENLHIPFNQPVYIPCINQLSDYVRLMIRESHASSKYKVQIQDSLMRALLYNLDSQISIFPSDADNHKHYEGMTPSQYRQFFM